MDAALSPILVLALMTPALQVSAQEQQELPHRVRRGDPVYVTGDAGTVKGKATDISEAALRALVGDTPSEWVDATVPTCISNALRHANSSGSRASDRSLARHSVRTSRQAEIQF
jgi:hypothetical protein